jgi:MSHA pilin protein MshC
MTNINAPKSSGFTLVELVMVIILIGVLSALGIGLFAGRSAFSPLLATQQLSSATLLAQQAALAGNAGGSLTISQTADNFVFTVGPGPLREFTLPLEGSSLTVANEALPLTINFNTFGAPVAGENISLTFAGDSSFDTCISSLGAVYAGGCQP